jgi:RNA polymerase sigma-70 factor (ECF subfamily)
MATSSLDDDGSERLAQLLARTALRDQAAFKALYDATVRCLRGTVLRLVRDAAWAEDILQEAYIAVWHSSDSYAAARSRPMTWLITVARNKALDALRSRADARANTFSMDVEGPIADELQARMADDGASPLDRLVQGMDAVRLKVCLQSLEAAQRQAISLAYYFGLTHSELAEHLHAPLGTVKAWVRRGLERLKGCVQAT